MNTSGLGIGAGKLIDDGKVLIADGALALYLALVWQIPNCGHLGCNAHERASEEMRGRFLGLATEAHGRSMKSKVAMSKRNTLWSVEE